MNKEELEIKYNGEEVLVLDTLFMPQKLVTAEGFVKADTVALEFVKQGAEFIPRADAELDVQYKQIIPYLIIRREGRYFLTTRLKGGGEARLHGKSSLGVGGHINPIDVEEGGNIIMDSMWRELTEELDFPAYGIDLEFHGFINSSKDEVSSVHLGLIFVADITLEDESELVVRETDKLLGGFKSVEDIEDIYPFLEGWSQIAFDSIVKGWSL